MQKSDTALDGLTRDVQSALADNNFDAAEAACQQILNEPAWQAEGLYLQAVIHRFAGRAQDAQASLDELKHAYPELGRAHQEQGYLNLGLGNRQGAIFAFDQATRHNPALVASWQKLAELNRAAGQIDAAMRAENQAQHIKALPELLRASMHMMHEGRLIKAEAACKRFLRENPQHIQGMRILADIANRLGATDEAEFLLESASAFAPENDDIRMDLVQILKKRQKFGKAHALASELAERQPDKPVIKSMLAIETMQIGRHAEACALFDEVLENYPNDPATLVSKGHALKTMGSDDEAVLSYQAAARYNPLLGDAWFSLSNLKTHKFSDDEIQTMQAALTHPATNHLSLVNIHFALGKAFEDKGQYERAFRHYDDGNEAKKRQIGYRADVMQAELQAQRAACTADLFDKQGGKGHAAPDPIFIVGLPRAGSTLIEQILASHSQIDGTLELPNILSLAHRLRGKKSSDSDGAAYPQNLHDLSGDELAQMGRDFIEETKLHRQGAAFFTDKMPNNFRHIGLIHLILPNAKIIDARRDPMDCCFSGFKQLFAQGQEFTYGLEEIGRYYADYVALMEHWHAVLPGKILHVQHEDVLDDLDGQVRRMLDYLGLPFEQACLDFHQTERAVRTASSAQVRQPLNRKGVGAWRPFEAYLDPLKQALGNHYDPARYQQENRHE